MVKCVALISGGGSNLQAVFDAIDSGRLPVCVAAVISSNDKAGGLARAEKRGVPTHVCALKDFDSNEARDRQIIDIISKHNPDYVLLLGYLGICTPVLVRAFKGRIINIHPALLPKHGGKGFYGANVHKAVIESGDNISGATVHYVDEGTDTGQIIAQRAVPVLPSDTPDDLASRVLNVEHELVVESLELLIRLNKMLTAK